MFLLHLANCYLSFRSQLSNDRLQEALGNPHCIINISTHNCYHNHTISFATYNHRHHRSKPNLSLRTSLNAAITLHLFGSGYSLAGLPWWLMGKEPTCQCRNPWVRKILLRRKWQPTPVFLPRKSHGERSLADYSPWGRKKVRHNLATKQQHSLTSLIFWCQGLFFLSCPQPSCLIKSLLRVGIQQMSAG